MITSLFYKFESNAKFRSKHSNFHTLLPLLGNLSGRSCSNWLSFWIECCPLRTKFRLFCLKKCEIHTNNLNFCRIKFNFHQLVTVHRRQRQVSVRITFSLKLYIIFSAYFDYCVLLFENWRTNSVKLTAIENNLTLENNLYIQLYYFCLYSSIVESFCVQLNKQNKKSMVSTSFQYEDSHMQELKRAL